MGERAANLLAWFGLPVICIKGHDNWTHLALPEVKRNTRVMSSVLPPEIRLGQQIKTQDFPHNWIHLDFLIQIRLWIWSCGKEVSKIFQAPILCFWMLREHLDPPVLCMMWGRAAWRTWLLFEDPVTKYTIPIQHKYPTYLPKNTSVIYRMRASYITLSYIKKEWPLLNRF